jgi:LysM repeat protein
MSYKTSFQIFILIVLLLATFASPGSARAWSNCGSTYVVQWGDSLSGIATYCGTSVAALYAANPGISGYLYAGQVLVIPDYNYCNCPQDGYGYTGTYTVQRGDIFSAIAKRYGVSVNSLWAANPHVRDIDRIYPGQVLYVPASQPAYQPVYQPVNQPGSSWFKIVTPSEPLVERSWGTVPPGFPTGSVKLINSANAEVYVSLQGTTSDGVSVINEYPVSGVMNVKVPAGWYIYVAWVGGEKFSGQFKLGGDSSHTLTFYINKVVVD